MYSHVAHSLRICAIAQICRMKNSFFMLFTKVKKRCMIIDGVETRINDG